MFSPEIVPSQRPSRKPRKCRRKLPMEMQNDIEKIGEDNSSLNLTGDFSPDESDYVPETEEGSSSESVEESPKKTAKTRTIKKKNNDVCRILKEKNTKEMNVCDDLSEVTTNINSTFNTPTSSKLASCVGSPYFNTNEILVDISNVQELLDDIENINPDNDDTYINRNDLRKERDIDSLTEMVEPQIPVNDIDPVIQNTDDNDPEADNIVTEPINIEVTNCIHASKDAGVIPGVPKLSNLALLKVQTLTYTGTLVGEEVSQNEDQAIRQIIGPDNNNPNQELEGQNNDETGRSRRRSRSEESWKDRLNKRLKNSGKSYVGVRNNKEQKEKEMGEVCSCRKECFSKIIAPERSQIFERFWKLGSHEKQWEYILRLISSQNIKKMQLERKSTRLQTIIYNLPQNVKDKVVVCKKMFLSTLGITEKWVYTAIEKENSLIEDLRGKHLNRPNRVKEDTAKGVMDHIRQFPVVDSHYTRKNSNRLYLNETLNMSKMYRLYKEWYGEQPDNDPTNLASKTQYETIFNTKFNYSFFKPKKDLCDICFIYENADEDRKNQLQESYDLHVKEKEAVRKLKDNEKASTRQDTTSVACFDLEKVLYIPQSEVSRFYYKRKYAVYNFTIYDVLMKKGFCYVWHQEIAKRGAIEISSCLWNYIKNHVVEKGKTEISFYSDSCAGQNRNRFVFAMFQHASRLFGIDICHRFFEKGHSQSEGDTMHACVERAKKNHIIYTPEQMYCIISNAKVEGDKFIVKEMTQSDFYDFKQLVNKPDVNWFQDDDRQKVFWSRVKEVNIKHGNPDKVTYKYSLLAGSESQTLTTNKVSSRRRRRGNNLREVTRLNPAYTESIPVPRPLYNDLMELCSAGAIPSAYHYFYNNLNPENSAETTEVNNESDSD